MEYLLEFHPAHTLFMFVIIGFVLGVIFTVWWDDQYQKEEQERKAEADDAGFEHKEFR